MVFGRIKLHCIDYFRLTETKIAESANISAEEYFMCMRLSLLCL